MRAVAVTHTVAVAQGTEPYDDGCTATRSTKALLGTRFGARRILPLKRARSGAQPLLDTLTAYLDTGRVAAEAARRLSLGVRAMTYRLGAESPAAGAGPGDPVHRYTLQTAVIDARLLDWPNQEL